MEALKSAARALFHGVGGTALLRRRYRSGLRILMYHRFPAAAEFDAQCEHLRRYYRPISMTEASEWLHRGKPLPPGAVVVTVDDGYRDFYVHAYPVLKSHGIPALVYIATDLPDKQTWLWTDQVTDAALKARLKKLPDGERRTALLTMKWLRAAPPPEHAPLSWDEIREMAAGGIEFGAHTRSHPILSRLPNRKAIEAEVAGSKERIEVELGSTVLHFCYPNGHPEDFSGEVVEVVRESGFTTAVTGVQGINFSGADPYRLLRLHQEPDRPVNKYAHQVAGMYRG
ncbi:MAG TPA: polysaccharide deacetylase family protein [Bryobacteraceae bacterium]|nr:polysaccharide deacetylase family protein [Bryobacteraceae bacterium]